MALDGGSWKDGSAELIALCDAVVLSQDFRVPGGDVGRVLEDVAALGPGFVARSRGGAPVEVLAGGVRSDVPVPAAGVVVDTLGAGTCCTVRSPRRCREGAPGECAAGGRGGREPVRDLRGRARLDRTLRPA